MTLEHKRELIKMIDLRSDTVTVPTKEMRKAMAQADVGDDVYGEDPTVNRLQSISAEMMGKESALFVPSGTMGNLISVLTHCNRGDQAIMGHLGHTFLFEVGGVSALGGVFPHTLPNQPDGTMTLEDIRSAIHENDDHTPRSRLIILENTHNRCGGVSIKKDYTDQVASLAHQYGMSLHIDGARIFNAASALNTSTAELVKSADSVTFCLSKGLCAPIGSVICGSKDFITQARKIRKQLGGGMRQAGVIAAAGIIAVTKMTKRLAEDHERARILARGLSQIEGLRIDMGTPTTNMLFISLNEDAKLTSEELISKLEEKGILIGRVGQRQFRLVTHFWIGDGDVQNCIKTFESILAS
jgi:threonine aldolase